MQSKQHMIAINGIYSESVKMASKMEPANVQVVQTSEQTKKDNKILRSIIDHGVGNFLELLRFAVHQGNKDLQDHLWSIITKVKQVIFFPVLRDEASASCNKEQLFTWDKLTEMLNFSGNGGIEVGRAWSREEVLQKVIFKIVFNK